MHIRSIYLDVSVSYDNATRRTLPLPMKLHLLGPYSSPNEIFVFYSKCVQDIVEAGFMKPWTNQNSRTPH